MSKSAPTLSDPFHGSDRIYADRLLAHTLVRQSETTPEIFTRAVPILRSLSRSLSLVAYIPVQNRVQRDALLCAMALHLAELAL